MNDKNKLTAHSMEKNKLSKLAHDIRNCLAIIQTDAEIALMEDTPLKETRETIRQIVIEAKNIDKLLG